MMKGIYTEGVYNKHTKMKKPSTRELTDEEVDELTTYYSFPKLLSYNKVVVLNGKDKRQTIHFGDEWTYSMWNFISYLKGEEHAGFCRGVFVECLKEAEFNKFLARNDEYATKWKASKDYFRYNGTRAVEKNEYI